MDYGNKNFCVLAPSWRGAIVHSDIHLYWHLNEFKFKSGSRAEKLCLSLLFNTSHTGRRRRKINKYKKCCVIDLIADILYL